mmetsp:Transcript_79655/g.174668  ORF Transcript_79655/g.174668 Transcript_79655/m.174668 type:complete len:244 (-) Transcript_79655:1575-2306(-)
MCLLELAAGNVHPDAIGIGCSMGFEEGNHVCLQAIVVHVGMQEAHPKSIRLRHHHFAGSVAGDPGHHLFHFCAPLRQGQHTKQIPIEGSRARAIVILSKLDDVLRKDLTRFRDDVVLVGLNPDVVSISVVHVGRLYAQAKATNKHVFATPAVANRNAGSHGEIFTTTEHLSSSPPRVESILRDGENIGWSSAVKPLDFVRLASKILLQFLTAVLVSVRQQGVVNNPRSFHLAAITERTLAIVP